MLKKFLRTSTAIAVFSLSACLLVISSAKSMENNENELGEGWTKFSITWRSAVGEKPVRKVVLEGPLFENAKERVTENFGRTKILDVDLKTQSRWKKAEIGWNPPYTKLHSEDDWYTQEQDYWGYQREFAFKNTDSFGSIVHFVDATSSSAGGGAPQLKRCPPIVFEGGFPSFGEEPIERNEIILYFLPGWKS